MKQHETLVLQWIAEHRGKLSEIARHMKPPVTPQFVALVLKGQRSSRNGRIERALREAGAPVK